MVTATTKKQLAELRGKVNARISDWLDKTKDRAPDEAEQRQLTELESESKDLDKAEEFLERRSAMQDRISKQANEPTGEDRPKDDPRHPKRLKEFRLARGLQQIHAEKRLDGLEAEITQEMENEYVGACRSLGGKPESRGNGVSLWLPHELSCGHVPNVRSELRTITDSTQMAGNVQTVTESSLMDVLRNASIAGRCGMRTTRGLVGNYKKPKKTLATSASWVGESTAPTNTYMTSGTVDFTPKIVTAGTIVSHLLTQMSNYDLEMEARRDIAIAIAVATDRAVFHGSGSSNQPEGIYANSDVRTIAIGTNGGAPTWAKVVEMMTKRAHANAALGTPVWATSSYGLGKLMTTLKDSANTVSTYLVDENRRLATYPIYDSQSILTDLDKGSATDTLTMLVFGDFSQIEMAMWGGVRTLYDPYTSQPDALLTIYQTCDIEFLYPEALSKCVDMTY